MSGTVPKNVPLNQDSRGHGNDGSSNRGPVPDREPYRDRAALTVPPHSTQSREPNKGRHPFRCTAGLARL